MAYGYWRKILRVNLVYDMLGWDHQSAAPKRWKLYELGLDWLVDDIIKQGIFRE